VADTTAAILEGHGLTLTYANGVQAVNDVDIVVQQGEIVGLVGESGCGKSSLAKLLLRLEQPSAGTLEFDGRDMLRMSGRSVRRLRRRLQIVPQDPATSLNPKLTISQAIEFNLRAHGWNRARRATRVATLLDLVGLPVSYTGRYPHELSGGQMQRVAIARALSTEPDLVICDEPVSALDKSIQAQILNLVAELQRELGVAFLFISHDLAVVEHISDRVLVMYLGRIVEEGSADTIMRETRHPYTRALLASVPTRGQSRAVLLGEPPSPVDPPSGCGFRTRCPHAVEACASYNAAPVQFGNQHSTRCLRALELVPTT
jgi:peptide/nickel transport system ATP-binding protein/oligopeptide transport system ATP-binding protein